MAKKVVNRLFDFTNGSTNASVQLVQSTINLDTNCRTDEVLDEAFPHYLCLRDFGDYFVLEFRTNDEPPLVDFVRKFDDLSQTKVSDRLLRQRCIKVCPDKNNPNVALIISTFITWEVSNYTLRERTCRMIFVGDSENNFALNNTMRLDLNNGIECFKDNSLLDDNDRDFIANTMLKQQQPDWEISQIKKADTSVAADILAEVRSMFSDNDVIRFDELKLCKGAENSKEELDELIGMNNIKDEIRILEARLKYVKDMEKRGFLFDESINLHMCFLGAPGTGKTTVARILTGIFNKYGYIKKNKCIEINARQLIGGFTGQTGDRTKKIIDAARGGVLFIDEAYTLVPDHNDSRDFSYEAVAQLLKEMEDSRGDLIVILAGYDSDMQKLFDMNEGLRSRVNKKIYFENYGLYETLEIFLNMLRKEKYRIDSAALGKLILLIKKCRYSKTFSNGRFVRNLYERIYEHHAYRFYSSNQAGLDRDTFTVDDIDDNDVCEPIIRSVR